MKLGKIKDYNKSVMRNSLENKELMLLPVTQFILKPFGYYSEASRADVEQRVSDTFRYGEKYYMRREEIHFNSSFVGMSENLLRLFGGTKRMINEAELIKMSELLTDKLWLSEARNNRWLSQQEVIEASQKKIITFSESMNDCDTTYSILMNSIIILIDSIILKGKVEDGDMIKKSYRVIDQYDELLETNKEKSNIVISVVGSMLDEFADTFIKPFASVELVKVGQTNTSFQLESLQTEYVKLKNKMEYAIGTSNPESNKLSIYRTTFDIVMATEEHFRNMLKIIYQDSLHQEILLLARSINIEDYAETKLFTRVGTGDDNVTDRYIKVSLIRQIFQLQDAKNKQNVKVKISKQDENTNNMYREFGTLLTNTGGRCEYISKFNPQLRRLFNVAREFEPHLMRYYAEIDAVTDLDMDNLSSYNPEVQDLIKDISRFVVNGAMSFLIGKGILEYSQKSSVVHEDFNGLKDIEETVSIVRYDGIKYLELEITIMAPKDKEDISSKNKINNYFNNPQGIKTIKIAYSEFTEWSGKDSKISEELEWGC